jgi:tRNA 5-methylaminomethyl-2-thiouridine biosynthesis bifunctional protein
VLWREGEPPRSRRFGDVYYSSDDGLAESRAVFLAGCGLPEAWRGRRRFAVGELGFGTGLNIAALLHLWDQTREPGARLDVFTVEVDPLSGGEAARALAVWPELARIAGLMTSRWPAAARGFHRIDLPELDATIDVAIMEAGQALAAWDGRADAWFLDGFAPALNPEIWRQEVLDLLARRSAAGARAATYTVAGAVRRGLTSAGFAVARAPGHARKRERLEARLPGSPCDRAQPRVAIVGAGIAGASLARALAAQGVQATVIEAALAGAGGSGAPAALMTPRLDAGLGPAAALFAQAARRAASLYDGIAGAVISRGALQLAQGPKDPARFAAIAASDLFEPTTMSRLEAAAVAARLGEPAPEGLVIETARVVSPKVILAAWLGSVVSARVSSLEQAGGAWRLIGPSGALILEADVVCLAGAMECQRLLTAPLGLTPVRGQASHAPDVGWETAAVFGAYAVSTGAGVLFGATHDRDDLETGLRLQDRARNLAAVRAILPGLADRLDSAAIADWSAIRATTSDYLPLAGPAPGAPPGVFILTGLGSRGFCLAPLLADHLAAHILGAPSPLPAPVAALVDPGRFAARAARKGRPRTPRATET